MAPQNGHDQVTSSVGHLESPFLGSASYLTCCSNHVETTNQCTWNVPKNSRCQTPPFGGHRDRGPVAGHRKIAWTCWGICFSIFITWNRQNDHENLSKSNDKPHDYQVTCRGRPPERVPLLEDLTVSTISLGDTWWLNDFEHRQLWRNSSVQKMYSWNGPSVEWKHIATSPVRQKKRWITPHFK